MIHKQTAKYRSADDYTVLWRCPVPLVKVVAICPSQQLHPLLGIVRLNSVRQSRLSRISLMLRSSVTLRFYHRFITDFDQPVDDYWMKQAADDFHLELMDEASF